MDLPKYKSQDKVEETPEVIDALKRTGTWNDAKIRSAFEDLQEEWNTYEEVKVETKKRRDASQAELRRLMKQSEARGETIKELWKKFHQEREEVEALWELRRKITEDFQEQERIRREQKSLEQERVRREQKSLDEKEKRENQRLEREIDKQEKRKGKQAETGKREEKQKFQKQKTGTDDSEKTDSLLMDSYKAGERINNILRKSRERDRDRKRKEIEREKQERKDDREREEKRERARKLRWDQQMADFERQTRPPGNQDGGPPPSGRLATSQPPPASSFPHFTAPAQDLGGQTVEPPLIPAGPYRVDNNHQTANSRPYFHGHTLQNPPEHDQSRREELAMNDGVFASPEGIDGQLWTETEATRNFGAMVVYDPWTIRPGADRPIMEWPPSGVRDIEDEVQPAVGQSARPASSYSETDEGAGGDPSTRRVLRARFVKPRTFQVSPTHGHLFHSAKAW